METSPDNSKASFPPAEVAGQLNPGNNNTHVHVDPNSSKAQAEADRKKREGKKKDGLQTLKSAVIVSAIIVAVTGAAFAIAKKLREK